MLVLFNFAEEPIDDKWKSVIFDKKAGIILTTKTSCQLFSELSRGSILSYLHQHQFHKLLQVRHKHVYANGNYVYFSLKGHARYNTDWVSLHHVKCFHKKEDILTIHTTGDSRYSFTFSDISLDIKHCLKLAINQWYLMKELILKDLGEMGLKYITHHDSILANPDYIMDAKLQYLIKTNSIAKIRRQMDEHIALTAAKQLACEWDIDIYPELKQQIITQLKRNDRIG